MSGRGKSRVFQGGFNSIRGKNGLDSFVNIVVAFGSPLLSLLSKVMSRMSLAKSLLSTTILWMIVSQPLAAEEKYKIRFRFEPGQQLKYHSLQAVTNTAATPRGTKEDVSKVDQTRIFTIGDVEPDGDADVSMQFEHVRMELQSNGGETITFDSSMKSAEVPKIFQATANKLKGAASKYQLLPSGTPVSEDGVEQIPKGGQASFMLPLPKDDVAIGDSWKVDIEVKVRIAEGIKRQVNLLRTYRLKSVENGIATIGFSTSIASSVRNTSVRAQLIQATPQGTIEFDLNKGQVLKRVLKVNNTVVGGLGAKTIYSSAGITVEKLVSVDSRVTKR